MAMHSAWGLATLLGLASPVWSGDGRRTVVLVLDVSSSVGALEGQIPSKDWDPGPSGASRVIQHFEREARRCTP